MALLAALAWPTQAQTVVRYVHTDALGSVVAFTDQSRAVVERREYEPYGTQLTPTVQDGPGYTGHVQDAATGLVYMQQRYYDPSIGRFVSVDPVTANGNTGGNFNRYWYAKNNPYRFTDPDGRAPQASTCGRLGGGSCSGTYEGSRVGPRSMRAGDNAPRIDNRTKADSEGVRLRPGVVIRDQRLQKDLEGLSKDLGNKEIDVVSGYRDQKKQDDLRSSGNQRAAKNSQHTCCVAADIKVKGMLNPELGRAAYDSGRFERVNVYSAPEAGVHVDYLDVGPGTQMYRDWKRVEP